MMNQSNNSQTQDPFEHVENSFKKGHYYIVTHSAFNQVERTFFGKFLGMDERTATFSKGNNNWIEFSTYDLGLALQNGDFQFEPYEIANRYLDTPNLGDLITLPKTPRPKTKIMRFNNELFYWDRYSNQYFPKPDYML